MSWLGRLWSKSDAREMAGSGALPIDRLFEALATGDNAARFQAAFALRNAPVDQLTANLPLLKRALGHASDTVRSIAAELLAKLGEGAAAASSELSAALRDEDVFVRVRAAQALCAGRVVSAEVISVLREIKGGEERADVKKIAKEALASLDQSLVQKVAPAEAHPRVTVGECSSCHKPLRVKADAVKPKMHLTCKCGASNLIERT